MRQIYKQLAAGAAFVLNMSFVNGQGDSSYSITTTTYYVTNRFSFLISSGSNGLNQYMMNRLALGGYMPTEKLENAETLIKKNNRTGLYMNSSLEICLQRFKDTAMKRWNFRPTHIDINQNNILGSQYRDGLWKLIFRGNENYLGQRLELSKTAFRQFASRTIWVNFSELYHSKNGKNSFRAQLGFSQILAYRNLKMEQGFLYTDSNRNYLEAQYNLDYTNSGRNDFPGVGYGFATHLYWSARAKKGLFQFGISNFGMAQISDASIITKQMDTSVRINQSSIGLKSLNSADWVEYFRDTLNRELAPDTSVKYKWIMTPFFASAYFYTKKISYGLDYLLMPGYLPRLTVSYLRLIDRGIFRLTPSIQLGGFDTYNVNITMNFRKEITLPNQKPQLGFTISLSGLEALAFPQKEHGAGVYFGLSYSPEVSIRPVSRQR